MQCVLISTFHGKRMNFGSDWFIKDISKILNRIADRITKVVEEESKASYLRQRKTQKTPSFIINSFKYTINQISEFEVTGIIQCGGDEAPYAIYVDEGHAFRNNKGRFEGYHFMSDGFKKGQEENFKIISDEFRKAGYSVFER